MGRVFLATDTKLNREVALKLLSEELRCAEGTVARFQREARFLATLNHPNIAQIYGFHDTDREQFLVLEFVAGETLADRLERGPLLMREALKICRQIAEAVEYAHEKGIIHRDLKPANVMLCDGGSIKVLDFGLARAAKRDSSSTDFNSETEVLIPNQSDAQTSPGIVMGTVGYMSPEQVHGEEVDRRSDIFSFGVILYQCVAGAHPFAARSAMETMSATLHREVDLEVLPLQTPDSVRYLLARCLERDRETRLQSIADARAELTRTCNNPSGSFLLPQGTDPQSRARTGARRHRTLIVASLAAVLLAGILGWWAGRRMAPQTATVPAMRFAFAEYGTDISPRIVSPDGQYFVCVVEDQLALQSADELELTIMEGTIGATRPFWSTDSRHIGFFVETEMKRVAVATLAIETLCQVPSGRKTGSWGPDGTILFENSATPSDNGIFLLAPNQLSPRKLEGFDYSKQHRPDQFWPRLLPDGRHFTIVDTSDGRARLMLATLDSGERKPIGFTSSKAEYSTSGHLLFVRDGWIFAQRFDLQTLTVRGDPQIVADDVKFFAPIGLAPFFVSNTGTLVYRPRTGEVTMQWFDRSGQPVSEATETVFNLQGATLSPDSRTLVMSVTQPRTGEADLWAIDFDRAIQQRLTSHVGTECVPVWSPDGTAIAFSADWEGPPNVYLTNFRNPAPQLLVPFDGSIMMVVGWSPDGSEVLYSIVEGGIPNDDLWAVDVESKETRKLLDNALATYESICLSISPNGRWMAYLYRESGQTDLYVRSYPAMTSPVRISSDGASHFAWDSMTSELVYIDNKGYVVAVEIGADDELEVGKQNILFNIGNRRPFALSIDPSQSRLLIAYSDLDRLRRSDIVITDWTRLLDEKQEP